MQPPRLGVTGQSECIATFIKCGLEESKIEGREPRIVDLEWIVPASVTGKQSVGRTTRKSGRAWSVPIARPIFWRRFVTTIALSLSALVSGSSCVSMGITNDHLLTVA